MNTATSPQTITVLDVKRKRGRPCLGTGAGRRIHFYASNDEFAFLNKLGNGNSRLGIRRLVQAALKMQCGA